MYTRYTHPSMIGLPRKIWVTCVGACLMFAAIAPNAVAIEIGEWRKTCQAANWKTGAIETVEEKFVRRPLIAPWFALTQRQDDGTWQIVYNVSQIRANGLGPTEKKFVFFHECAHANKNSMDELVADCEALTNLRADAPLTEDMIEGIKTVLLRIGRRFPLGPCAE